ncbi:hypothetical protein F5Y11DRAFT_363059 [Daldinia sp. FL1419]|nr:hypothetical protein F5Y11DRAFT_363059 [Daldinia sp. FL1419]
MLEDEIFLASFMKKNGKVLAEHCEILTTFLEEHGLLYCKNVNAGVFIWVNLRCYLYSGLLQDGNPNLLIASLSSSDLETYRDRERRLFRRCFENGVVISLGSGFSTEKLGWFRISFNVEKQGTFTYRAREIT